MSLCLLASVIFWIFNALNKSYSTTLRFPLKVEFDAEKFALAETPPNSVSINVAGTGWDLLRQELGIKLTPVVVTLDRPQEIQKIVGSSLAPVLVSQLGKLKLNFVVTDTLHLRVEKKSTRRYKLFGDLTGIDFDEGFGRISRVVVLPDSVKVEGPESILNHLGDSIPLPVTKRQLNEDFRQEVEISFDGSRYVTFTPSVFQIMFEVAPVRVIERKLKLTSIDRLLLTVDSVHAQLQIPVNRTDEFDSVAHRLEAFIAARQFKRQRAAVPRIKNLPPYVHVLTIDSVYRKAN